jgi:hypothetical protein
MARRLVGLVVVLGSLAAVACPVCGVGPEFGQGTYLVMSGILSALPLVAIGSVVAWVALRMRAAAKLEAAEEARLVTRYGAGPHKNVS